MADYKELIRRAIQALPENNGASRRAVYEKARAALVGQLRGISPPLAARDITQHRLQLEDCIRQVEQEASEAVIASLKQNEQLAGKAPPPATNGAAAPGATSNGHAAPRPASGRGGAVAGKAGGAATHRQGGAVPADVRLAPSLPAGGAAVPARAPTARVNAGGHVRSAPAKGDESADSIEAIIAAAEQAGAPAGEAPGGVIRTSHNGNGVAVEDPSDGEDDGSVIEMPAASEAPMFKLEARGPGKVNGSATGADAAPLPAIVARAEAAKAVRPAARGATPAQARAVAPSRRPVDPRGVTSPSAAMSSVREVDVEPRNDGDPQVAIERAIATLEREARNDGEPINGVEVAEVPAEKPRRRTGDNSLRETAAGADALFTRGNVEAERSGGGNAIALFLLLFLVLLVAAGGGGFWAWHEGYIDFDSMFGKTPQVASTQAPAVAPTPATPVSPSTAQTNTEPASNTPSQSAEQLSTAPATPAPAATPTAPASAAPATTGEPSAQDNGAPKSEERLSQTTATPAPVVPDLGTKDDSGTAPAPAVSGNQSLLLEASQDGTTGAVPFSGTVDWSEGKDEMGQPTLIGKANIPARNLGVSVLIRKNTDQTLPASNLMEINFSVGQSFIGGSIAGLPGVLLKNEELVQGTPLVGASARVVGNSFLFALSSSAADEATNDDLLTSRKWMDLAIIYATGKRAIITLEKDDKATALFNQVFADWAKQSSTAAPASAAAPAAATPAAK